MYGCRICEARPPEDFDDSEYCYNCYAHYTIADKESEDE